MLKKTSVIVFFLVLAVVLYFVYQHYRVPDDVTAMSGSPVENVAMISLLTAVVSLLTSLVGLAMKIIEMNKKGDDD